jgi:trk system potassium uptake protein TrkA
MKIIILGAGQVGGTLAENLASEANDITVVDQSEQCLAALRDRLDIGTIAGLGSLPQTLDAAGANDADMLIAVTNSDEVNMVACQIAHTLFHTPSKIARIRSAYYSRYQELFNNAAIPIDVLISPEQLVTHTIVRLIEHPGSLQVLDFAEGKVQIVAVKAYYGGPLVGKELSCMRQLIPDIDTRVAAIFRRNQAIMPKASTVVEVDDEVFFIAATPHISKVMGALRRMENPYRRILIAGGGHIGSNLAKTIEDNYRVKLIEHSSARCEELSRQLTDTIVLQGNATNRQLLVAEDIEETDVFCALTNDDEANIMSSLLAKRLGARKVMAIITNPAYVDLIQGGEIDVAISPQQSTTGALLTHIRRGDVSNVHSLRRGAAEAIETIAHGDRNSSKVVGRKIGDIKLPPGASIGALIRDDEVIIAHQHIVIQEEDHVILFLVDKKRIRDIEKLFQVGVTFF